MLNCPPPFPSTRLVSFPVNQYTVSGLSEAGNAFSHFHIIFPSRLTTRHSDENPFSVFVGQDAVRGALSLELCPIPELALTLGVKV